MHHFSLELDKYDIKADILCFSNLRLEKVSSIKWPKQIEYYFTLLESLQTSWISRAFRKLLDRFFLKKLISVYDLVDFHAYYPYYNNLMRECIRAHIKFDITLWGSDLMRATKERKESQRYGFDKDFGLLDVSVLESKQLVDAKDTVTRLSSMSKEMYDRTYQCLAENYKLVEILANKLLECETLSGNEIEQLLKNAQNEA